MRGYMPMETRLVSDQNFEECGVHVTYYGMGVSNPGSWSGYGAPTIRTKPLLFSNAADYIFEGYSTITRHLRLIGNTGREYPVFVHCIGIIHLGSDRNFWPTRIPTYFPQAQAKKRQAIPMQIILTYPFHSLQCILLSHSSLGYSRAAWSTFGGCQHRLGPGASKGYADVGEEVGNSSEPYSLFGLTSSNQEFYILWAVLGGGLTGLLEVVSEITTTRTPATVASAISIEIRCP
ncbi:hypothetical protein VNO77_07892 [Canavalia gladiata]|uniref:Uncharacterized protein n=1 Tax=Canavalia gladiata TaxID=3824 RepID=A0AAN9MER7_CANGL